MTTGVKIAIGCGVLVIIGIIAVAAAVFGGAYWLKGKTEEFTGNENKIEELQKQANATPFDRPADNVIREDRFVKFLDVRKRVFGTYEKHRASLEAMNQKKEKDFGDVTAGFSVLNEIRLAQAQALADVGMSEDEYLFMVEQVYKTAWASSVVDSTGKQPSAAMSDAFAKAQEAMRQAQVEAGRAKQQADRADDETTQKAAEEAEEGVDKGIEELGRAGQEARENTDMDVPPANIALFKK